MILLDKLIIWARKHGECNYVVIYALGNTYVDKPNKNNNMTKIYTFSNRLMFN